MKAAMNQGVGERTLLFKKCFWGQVAECPLMGMHTQAHMCAHQLLFDPYYIPHTTVTQNKPQTYF